MICPSTPIRLLTRTISRPGLSQEFVGNLGMLGDITMDPVEFQNLFTD